MSALSPSAKAFLRSIFTVLFIAGICSFGVGLIARNLMIGFGVGIILILVQLVFGYYFSLYIENQQQIAANMLIDSVIDDAIEMKAPTSLSCAYCNEINIVPLSLLEENSFDCPQCQQANKVYMQFTTVRITQPLAKKTTVKEVDMDEPTQRQTALGDKVEVN